MLWAEWASVGSKTKGMPGGHGEFLRMGDSMDATEEKKNAHIDASLGDGRPRARSGPDKKHP